MRNDNYSILVIDSDRKFLDSLSSDPAAQKLPPVLVFSATEAEHALVDPQHAFAAIFINPIVTGRGGLSLIRLAHERRPGIPVFVLYHGNLPFTSRELSKLAIHQALLKPVSYSQMTSLVSPTIFSVAPPKGVEIIESPSPEDREFIAVPVQNFYCGTKSFFDVYVRLSSGRYLKILHANESFSEDRLKSYVDKKLTHFYLSRTGQDRCLSYCDTLAAVLLSHKDVSPEMKMARAMDEGDDILKSIRENGLDELHCEYASAFIDHVRSLVISSGKKQEGVIESFLSNSSSYEHAVSTTVIASLLTLPLKIEASSAYHIVGMATMLHDIGLNKMPKSVQNEDESEMSPEELDLYYTHPDVGADMLREFKSLDSAVIQAVAQHHERRKGEGFPRGLGAGQINRVAEIIGISDEFVARMDRAEKIRKSDPHYDPLQAMEEVYDDFSPPVVEAFKTIFVPKEKIILGELPEPARFGSRKPKAKSKSKKKSKKKSG